MGAGLELLVHLGVHVYHLTPPLGHGCVPHLDLLLDPVAESLADDSGQDVADPLLRHLIKVGRVRAVQGDGWVLRCEFPDVLQGQVLIGRHVDGLDLGVLDVLLPASDDVL